jgi:hypothetical protein
MPRVKEFNTLQLQKEGMSLSSAINQWFDQMRPNTTFRVVDRQQSESMVVANDGQVIHNVTVLIYYEIAK